MIQDAWGWCTGMTQRDGMGRVVGGGFRMGNACTPMVNSCWCMAKPIQNCKVERKKETKQNKTKVKTHSEPLHWVTSNEFTGPSGDLVSHKRLDWNKLTMEGEYVLEKWCTNKSKDIRVLKFSLSKNYAMKTLETWYLGSILWGKDCHES